MKRIMLGLCVVLLASAVSAQTRPEQVTLLVVPARYSVLQVAFDLFRKFPVVLVSYQGDAGTEAPLLHAWNGREWSPVSLPEYDTGSFLRTVPGQAVLVGDDALLPPVLAGSVASWCPRVLSVPEIDTAALVNAFGKILSFKPADFKWFARRYNLTLTDANEPRRSDSWYDGGPYEDWWTRRHRRQKEGREIRGELQPRPAPVREPVEPVALPEPPPAAVETGPGPAFETGLYVETEAAPEEPETEEPAEEPVVQDDGAEDPAPSDEGAEPEPPVK